MPYKREVNLKKWRNNIKSASYLASGGPSSFESDTSDVNNIDGSYVNENPTSLNNYDLMSNLSIIGKSYGLVSDSTPCRSGDEYDIDTNSSSGVSPL